jgi:CheY-like chemotaxis protein
VDPNKYNVLLCDDDQLILNVVSLSLELTGYNVTKAVDGCEALALISGQTDPFHVAIVDHVMPNLDGLGLVKELKTRKFQGKIIVLSGNLNDEIQKSYKKLGVDQIMAKPYQMGHLQEAVAALLPA